jgi:hypothetical protein
MIQSILPEETFDVIAKAEHFEWADVETESMYG